MSFVNAFHITNQRAKHSTNGGSNNGTNTSAIRRSFLPTIRDDDRHADIVTYEETETDEEANFISHIKTNKKTKLKANPETNPRTNFYTNMP